MRFRITPIGAAHPLRFLGLGKTTRSLSYSQSSGESPPTAITADFLGNVYVAGPGMVDVYDADGRQLRDFANADIVRADEFEVDPHGAVLLRYHGNGTLNVTRYDSETPFCFWGEEMPSSRPTLLGPNGDPYSIRDNALLLGRLNAQTGLPLHVSPAAGTTLLEFAGRSGDGVYVWATQQPVHHRPLEQISDRFLIRYDGFAQPHPFRLATDSMLLGTSSYAGSPHTSVYTAWVQDGSLYAAMYDLAKLP